jgi:molybdopterin-containing oxidoreductase family iron-sulfur binding subunit
MKSKQYWSSVEELQALEKNGADQNQAPANKSEFQEELPVVDLFAKDGDTHSSRRDFLKILGFSVSAATLAASCEVPVRKAIPYVVKPEDITPGVPTYYASTFINGSDWTPIMVKTREGRPIKIEGNKHSKVTEGAISAKALASVLSLYDSKRVRSPKKKNGESWSSLTWDEVDTAIGGKLGANPASRIAILTPSIISPSTRKAIDQFKSAYPNTRHVEYDAVSDQAVLEANNAMFGQRAFPDYRLEKAKVIVSLGADYLGSWGNSQSNAKRWSKMRALDRKASRPDMSRTYQFEARMSRTGSNADYRQPMAESQLGLAMVHLYNKVAAGMGAGSVSAPSLDNADADAMIAAAAKDLIAARGKSVVMSSSNDVNVQTLCNRINSLLGNYGSTLSWDHAVMMKRGDDTQMQSLVRDMSNGAIDILWVAGANPAYDHAGFEAAMANVELKLSSNVMPDETALACDFLIPDHHALENWNDAEAVKGHYNIAQPTIAPLFKTRAFQQTLLSWSGYEGEWFDFMAENWRTNILATESNSRQAWTKAVQLGVYDKTHSMSEEPAGEDSTPVSGGASASSAASAIASAYANRASGVEINIYEDPVIGNGSYTGNPWLQETPNSITKVTWDNVAEVNPGWGRENGLKNGDIIRLSNSQGSLEVPVLLQPGQAKNSIAVALGYGRSATGNPETDNGGNAYAIKGADMTFASWEATGGKNKLARTQDYDSLFDDAIKRPHVKETTLAQYQDNKYAGNEDREDLKAHLKSFYPDRFGKKNGIHWGMSIDLSSCIGCAACHVSCQSENNIPVVGKSEIARHHEMHWIRIDRYYAGSEDNPEVVFQPMLCQHCDQAPCENVCPVAATNHSSEGLNQMAYNRCIGTRYCANNCPYKVRRFNWYDYLGADSFGTINDGKVALSDSEDLGMLEDVTRMVLNPDVTVRSRGVMEKCSFCAQRLQEGKLKAKKEGRPLRDGEIVTACQAACSTGAIQFGNLWDEDSVVYQESEENERAFRVIEELHTLPSITYLTKVRNKDAADHKHDVPFEGTLSQA